MPDHKSIPKDKHLQSAIYGTPKVNPDEQRHYLGTFRERVALTITTEQLMNTDWSSDFTTELTNEQAEIVFFNGHIEQSKLRPYILAATKSGVNFTIKNNPEYHTRPTDLAVVVASKKAIYVQTIDIAKKYPSEPIEISTSKETPKKTFWSRLFHS